MLLIAPEGIEILSIQDLRPRYIPLNRTRRNWNWALQFLHNWRCVSLNRTRRNWNNYLNSRFDPKNRLLIAPEGIEISFWSYILTNVQLLIAPEGIEINLIFLWSFWDRFILLIAPEGIEIIACNQKQRSKNLLIAPEGIEINLIFLWSFWDRFILLIAPEGIEITFASI